MSTRLEIRELARLLSDQDSSDFPTNDQYNILLKFAARRVWLDVVRAGFPADFSSLNITSNGATKYSTSIPLSGGLVSIKGVFSSLSGQRFELKRIQEADRAYLLSTTSSFGISEYYSASYNNTTGLNIELFPPSSGVTYSVDFVLSFGDFVDDTTEFPGPLGSDELVAIRAAINAMAKEGDGRRAEVAVKEQDYKTLLQSVTDTATFLDARNPAKIRDVLNNNIINRSSFDYNIGGYGD